MAALDEIRRREALLLAEHLETTETSAPDLIRAIWGWIAAPERAPFLRLFFEVYVQAANHPEAYSVRGRAMITDWLVQFSAGLSNSRAESADPAFTTLVIAVLRGLLLDRLSTDDHARTDDALERFALLVDSMGLDASHAQS